MWSGILLVVAVFIRVDFAVFAGYVFCYTGELEENVLSVSLPTVQSWS